MINNRCLGAKSFCKVFLQYALASSNETKTIEARTARRKNFITFTTIAAEILSEYDTPKSSFAFMSLSWVFSEIPANILEGESFSDEFKSEFYQDANSLKSYII